MYVLLSLFSSFLSTTPLSIASKMQLLEFYILFELIYTIYVGHHNDLHIDMYTTLYLYQLIFIYIQSAYYNNATIVLAQIPIMTRA